MARASYKHKSGFGNMFIGRPNELHCNIFSHFNVSSENEASLLSYFNCKLPNFILSLRKIRKTFPNQSLDSITTINQRVDK
jgi:hypothetical protein